MGREVRGNRVGEWRGETGPEPPGRGGGDRPDRARWSRYDPRVRGLGPSAVPGVPVPNPDRQPRRRGGGCLGSGERGG